MQNHEPSMEEAVFWGDEPSYCYTRESTPLLVLQLGRARPAARAASPPRARARARGRGWGGARRVSLSHSRLFYIFAIVKPGNDRNRCDFIAVITGGHIYVFHWSWWRLRSGAPERETGGGGRGRSLGSWPHLSFDYPPPALRRDGSCAVELRIRRCTCHSPRWTPRWLLSGAGRGLDALILALGGRSSDD